MSSKYRIRPVPQAKVPPAPYQRDIVKRDLCGDIRTLPLPISQIAYAGISPRTYQTFDIGGQGTIVNPSQAQTFILDFSQTNSLQDNANLSVFNFYLEYSNGQTHAISLRASGTKAVRPPLFFTIFPYDYNNPRDNSKVTLYFSSTYRGQTVFGELVSAIYTPTDQTPALDESYWDYSTDEFATSVPLPQNELVLGYSTTLQKLTPDFSISHYIRLEQDRSPGSNPIYFSRIIHLTACFLDPLNCKPSATALASIQRNMLQN